MEYQRKKPKLNTGKYCTRYKRPKAPEKGERGGKKKISIAFK